jgi:hypothetical protein
MVCDVIIGLDFCEWHANRLEFDKLILHTNRGPIQLQHTRSDLLDEARVIMKPKLSEIEGWELLKSQAGDALSRKEREEFEEVLANYADVFSKNKLDLGASRSNSHAIALKVGQQEPVNRRPFRVAPEKLEEMRRQLKEMAQAGVIERSNSAWCAPVVLAKKKDGSLRFCVDYRGLNAATTPDRHPIPNVQDLLREIQGNTWFATIDLRSGFWQVPLRGEDKEKTAFAVPGAGLWQFTRMPFGLCNASATFQRMMERVLEGLPFENCRVYIDDILVSGKSFQELLASLSLVLSRLRREGLKISAKKCKFLQRTVNFLGHVVGERGIEADPAKLETVLGWKCPRNLTELRAFIGFCSYYRRFICGFAELAKPLHELEKKGAAFRWGEMQQAAFDSLKAALCKPPVLGHAHHDGAYVLDCDASGNACGAVLQQRSGEELRVLGYYSQCFSKEEKNYCVTRRELLAVLKALEHFRGYVLGHNVTVRTDHAALSWLMKLHCPDGQLARWLERLQEYTVEIVYRRGVKHINADALSRKPCDDQRCRVCPRAAAKENRTVFAFINFAESLPNLRDRIRAHIADDPDMIVLLRHLQEGTQPAWNDISPLSAELQALYGQLGELRMMDSVIWRQHQEGSMNRQLQLFIPTPFRREVLSQLHDAPEGGHLGSRRTLEKARGSVFWPGMKREILLWCTNCETCCACKGPGQKGRAPLGMTTSGTPWQRVAVDVMGPLPTTARGNRYVLVAQDYFTKWPEAFPMAEQSSSTVARLLVEDVFARYGCPVELHTDQGSNFESQLCQLVWERFNIKKTRTTPYHPESDGMVERLNRTLKEMLRKFCHKHQADWDDKLPLLLLAYRSSQHASTQFTPARLQFGRELRLPLDLAIGAAIQQPTDAGSHAEALDEMLHSVHEFARSQLRIQARGQKTYYDRRAADDPLEPDTLVWVYTPAVHQGENVKLAARWAGPYKIIRRCSDLTYLVQMQRRNAQKVLHRNRLCRYLITTPHLSAQDSWATPQLEQEGGTGREQPGRVVRKRCAPDRFL